MTDTQILKTLSVKYDRGEITGDEFLGNAKKVIKADPELIYKLMKFLEKNEVNELISLHDD